MITADSKAGPQAWVDAYHDQHSFPSVAPLPIKSGALQGVVGIDNALNQRFESLHIVYDGINGQLPNLDLFNTAVSIASGQMGIGVTLQRMWKHDDSYRERLQTMLRGMVRQGLGHASGPHSSFIPYHIDAITLQAVGNGWQDEMAMGRCIESIFRSLNNLLEHLHQSFFFYLLMQANRFVSIGTYLPSAMLVAVNFTIMAIVLWIQSGRSPAPKVASTTTEKSDLPEVEVIEKDGLIAVSPKRDLKASERQLFIPIALVIALHFLGVVPLYIFNNTSRSVSLLRYCAPPLPAKPLINLLESQMLPRTLQTFTASNILLPTLLATLISRHAPLNHQQLLLTQCISLVLLGMFLATLATLNFSLAFLIGLLASPLSFIGPSLSPPPSSSSASSSIESAGKSSSGPTKKYVESILLQTVSPPVVAWVVCAWSGVDMGELLAEAAFGWKVSGLWTQVVVWCVWWPAWLVGAVLANPIL